MGEEHWCPTGNELFQLGDVVLIRRQVLDVLEISCVACGGHGVAERSWVPADVAPVLGDGNVDVGDVVRLLRLAVGLDTADADGLVVSDVAPTVAQGDLSVVTGDGRIDVSDVVTTLRAAVGLVRLAWPERVLVLRLPEGASAMAFSLSARRWPAWAKLESVTCDACAREGGSLDVADGRFGITGVVDAAPWLAGGPVATLRYRSPQPVDVSTLDLASEVIGPDLDTLPVEVSLDAR